MCCAAPGGPEAAPERTSAALTRVGRATEGVGVATEFGGLTPEWAADVASHLDRFAGDRMPGIDDLWVSPSSVLLVRYRMGDERLAIRARLDLDPTSWEAPSNSKSLAPNLLHSLHASGEPERTDADGYCRWGERP